MCNVSLLVVTFVYQTNCDYLPSPIKKPVGASLRINTAVMEHHLRNDTNDYLKCLKILEGINSSTVVFKSMGSVLGLLSCIPFVGIGFIIPKIAVCITTCLSVLSYLDDWENNRCYENTRPCMLMTDG